MEISREITRANLLHKILNRTSSESALQCSAGCFYKIIGQIKNSGTCGHELLHKVKTSELILSLFFWLFSLLHILLSFLTCELDFCIAALFLNTVIRLFYIFYYTWPYYTVLFFFTCFHLLFYWTSYELKLRKDLIFSQIFISYRSKMQNIAAVCMHIHNGDECLKWFCINMTTRWYQTPGSTLI